MKKLAGKILVVDDNENVLKSLKLILRNEFELVETIKNPNQLHGLLTTKPFDIILLDMNFTAGVNTGNEGLYWLSEALKINPDFVVIMLTAYGDIELSVEAMKRGATDFIVKPWDNEKLIATIKTGLKLSRSKQEVKTLKQKQVYLGSNDQSTYQKPIGTSPAFVKILETVSKVAKTDANVLILGENGTGKELIAREVHRQSNRSKEVMISLDLTALSESLFESELFGHTKGAFTDAKESRIGRIESASGGTLFLDEIGNLGMNLQSKLLAVLQNREVTPLGSNTPVPVDVRLISATNKNLAGLIQNDLFREDLLYRINTIQLEIPPLRERKEDIPVLTEYFLHRLTRKYNKPNLKISKSALDKLQEHRWPGNIRELEHAIEKAVILTESGIIRADDFYFTSQPANTNLMDTFNLEEVEQNTIARALLKCSGNISKTAEMLGVTRKTLYKKIEKYGL
ncbi:MAG: sigma-54 dependent transcriptional regulator [Bacteroidales bacterium]|jgi:DNA-binding NtrC family response regulator|nr:sigma-54 dependent transcriptional regulator [Bacteroidales bacterium]